MSQYRQEMERLIAAFGENGRQTMRMVEDRLAGVPRGDISGWYYIAATAADLADGRKQATIKPKDAAVGAGNPALGPFPCVRGYTPVVGHRVLVTWVAGDRADGVIMG